MDPSRFIHDTGPDCGRLQGYHQHRRSSPELRGTAHPEFPQLPPLHFKIVKLARLPFISFYHSFYLRIES